MKRLIASLLVAASPALAQVVPWFSETSPVLSTRAGDPALVVDTGLAPLVVGTDTQANGVYAFEVDGGLVQFISSGLVRAADARGALVVVTSANDQLLFFRSTGGQLELLEPLGFSVPSPAHVALGRKADGGFELWVDTSSLELRHFSVSPVVDGGVTVAALPSLQVAQVASGLALDDRTGQLYVGQPTLGVLRVEPNGATGFLLSIDAGTLGEVVGGLDLFLAADGGALLFSGDPAASVVAVHAVSGTQATLGARLQLGAPDGGQERVQLPRYVDVAERPFAGFPRGALVVQDGVMGNYKVVDLERVHAVYPLPAAHGAPGATPDAGVPDAGTGADAGVPDAGSGAGGGGGSTGIGPGRVPPSADFPKTGCGCSAAPLPLLPALLLLWWIRRLRS